MRKVFVSAVTAALVLAGCASMLPGGVTTSQPDPNTFVADMGYADGKTITVNLGTGKAAYTVLAADSGVWAVSDIYSYDVTLTDITDATPKVLTTFNVVCSSGHAQAVFEHLKTGRKYQVSVVAKGNKGGTSGDTVLNSGVPAIGIFDLTDTTVTTTTLTAAIQVKLDGGAPETTGTIDIIPVAGQGGSGLAETGHGYCVDPCTMDHVITAGTSSFDSTYTSGTNGDPFSADQFHNHWTNSNNWSSFVQRELGADYWVDQIAVGAAYTDLSQDPCTKIYLKLRLSDGTWTTADYLENTNLKNYSKTLDKPLRVNAFRLEMYNKAGWFSAQQISIIGKNADCGGPAPTAAPSQAPGALPTPVATPTPTCAPATPTPAPSATPKPSAAPTATPTPAPTATPTPKPTATPTPAPTATPRHYKTCSCGSWGDHSNPAYSLLSTNFTKCFTSTGCQLGKSTRTLLLRTPDEFSAFMHIGGTPGIFAHLGQLLGAQTTPAGAFGCQLAAFKCNLDMSDKGCTGVTDVPLRNVRLVSGPCSGYKLDDIEDCADRCITGDYSKLPSGCTISKLTDILSDINLDRDGEMDSRTYDCSGK